MNDIEQRLANFFEHDGSRAEPDSRLDDVMLGTPQMRMSPINERRSWARAIAPAAAVAALTIGGLAVITRSATSEPVTTPPPLPAATPVNGIGWTVEAEIKVTIARDILMHECMAAAGWNYDLADPSVYVEEMGTWVPHPVLGIGNVKSAVTLGYHQAPGATATLDNFARTLSPDDEKEFSSVLHGTSNGVTSTEGCFITANAPLGRLLEQNESARVSVNETGIDQERVTTDTKNDPRTRSALDQWRTCLNNTVGETAETPNDLALQYAFESGTSSREIEIATADAQCQSNTELVSTWSQVYAEYLREALGDNAALFDQLALNRAQIIEQVEEILNVRDITIPNSD